MDILGHHIIPLSYFNTLSERIDKNSLTWKGDISPISEVVKLDKSSPASDHLLARDSQAFARVLS